MMSPLLRLIVGQIFLHACMTGMRLATPLLALRDGYSALSVGVLLALFSLTQVFMAIPAGRYTDRHGLQKPMRMSVLVAAGGAGLSAVWPTFPVMCVSALLTGGATGLAIIALQRHVGRSARDTDHLKESFSWLAIGPSVSNFMGPMAAGLMIDHAGAVAADTMGFRAAFVLLCVMPLITWFWVRQVPELPLQIPHTDAANHRIWDLLREPLMRRLLLVNWMLSSCWDVHTFVVPILGHERGFSASVVGFILGSFAVASALIRVVLPKVAKHLEEFRILTIAMIMTALIFAVYPFMQSPMGMGVCSVLLGFALGVVQPMVMSTLHQITPHHRQGEALGLRIMTVNASSVLMPMLFGVAGAAVGIGPVFWLVGLVVGAGSRSAWHLRPPTAAD
jgi:MFS family permease